ncbi:hypothetical protein EV182_000311 [Spiromyces aspiralis]|uniref:Uncharacterized protein n=1 Tax=Spiromyces aspiralis TaxID=68401 RepID=A0ACC1HPP5_9FUNG|nr:hypothetical protein EV182_000311 [Spiromyces aspiralis]
MPEKESWQERTAKFALGGATIGFFLSAAQNSFQSHNHGAMGVFTRTGGTIGYMAAMGGIFAGTEALTADIREKEDYWNTATAGCAAGFIAGIRKRSFPLAIGSCLFIGTTMGLYDYCGGIDGKLSAMTVEEREQRRKNFLGVNEPPK